MAFAVGALQALLVLWIRRSVREPEKWQKAKQAAKEAGSKETEQPGNKELGGITQLFKEPSLRRNTIAATLMATAGIGGLWGIGFWTPELTKIALTPLNLSGAKLDQYKSIVFIAQQFGAFLAFMRMPFLRNAPRGGEP